MKILTISDEECLALWDYYMPGRLEGYDLIIACGELSKNTFEGAKAAGGNAVWFAAKPELISALPEMLQDGDCILVKASHSCAFEEITKILTEM